MRSSNPSTQQDQELIKLLLKRQAELNSLLELSQAINRNASLKELLEMLKVILRVHMNIKKFRLFMKKERLFYNLTGFGDEHFIHQKTYRSAYISKEAYFIPRRAIPKTDLFNHYEHYLPIMHNGKLQAFVLVRSMDEDLGLLHHDLNFVQTLVSQIVAAHENKKLLKDKLEKQRLRRELDLGRQVQYMLIPEQAITDDAVEISAWYQPHDSIGGDYFDFAKINEQELMWCIADVSGKGISAALLMANLQASLRALFAISNDPMEVIRRLNEIIWKNTRGDRYITLFLAVYHIPSGQLRYVNAGHQPPMLFQSNACYPLKSGTVMLGAFDELPFLSMGNAQLSSGDMVFNYTDGLIERKKIQEHLTEEQVMAYLCTRTNDPLQELHESLLSHIREGLKAKAPADDLTLLTVRIK